MSTYSLVYRRRCRQAGADAECLRPDRFFEVLNARFDFSKPRLLMTARAHQYGPVQARSRKKKKRKKASEL